MPQRLDFLRIFVIMSSQSRMGLYFCNHLIPIKKCVLNGTFVMRKEARFLRIIPTLDSKKGRIFARVIMLVLPVCILLAVLAPVAFAQTTYVITDGDEVIVLVSSFDVDETGGDGSLNPDSTYTKWMWIMARQEGGKWQHVDHGY
jgi:hypothetical protein